MIAAPLCRLSDIPDPGAKGFAVTHRGQRVKVFVVHRDGGVFGYVDSCPHLGVPLALDEDAYLDLDKSHILCANHAARFHIDSGLCVWGPCAGRSLEPYPVIVRNGELYAAEPAIPPNPFVRLRAP